MSLRIFMRGDVELARGLVEGAQGLLGKLKIEMGFNDLSQLARTYVLPESGEVIRVQSFFGQDTITIEVPIEDVIEVEEEEIVIFPLIIRFKFFGTDGYWYFLFWNADEDVLYDFFDKDSEEPIPQPITEDGLKERIIGEDDVINGSYLDFEDLEASEDLPSIDFEQTSGVDFLKKIRLFPFGTSMPWKGGSRKFEEIDLDKISYDDPTYVLYVDGDRVYIVLFILSNTGADGIVRYTARLLSYDLDLNGMEPGLRDIHTKDLYTYVRTHLDDVGERVQYDYYVSHGKVIYALPNIPEDVRGFCATKELSMILDGSEFRDRADGIIRGAIPDVFGGEPRVFFEKSFATIYDYTGKLEIPNFWVGNVSSAITNKGAAVIFEHLAIEDVFEFNGSPFQPSTAEYDIHTAPTYDITGRVWVQRDIGRIEGTDKTGEESYDYQWNNFKEINFSITEKDSMLDMIKNHPMYETPRRVFASMYDQ